MLMWEKRAGSVSQVELVESFGLRKISWWDCHCKIGLNTTTQVECLDLIGCSKNTAYEVMTSCSHFRMHIVQWSDLNLQFAGN